MNSDLLVSATKASCTVILVLAYGYFLRKFDFISREGESNISRLCTKVFLPALLFTEIGPLATTENLKRYWPIIPLSVLFQSIALVVALVGRLAGMPQHFVPIFIFNNVTSLPLLLLGSLAATGGLDTFMTGDRTRDSLVKTGRVYILINALVGNLTRFAFGPYLMKARPSKVWFRFYHDVTPENDVHALPGDIVLPEEDEEPHSVQQRILLSLETARIGMSEAINPPLAGGILAIFLGIIPWFHRELFSPGILASISESLNNLGRLFSALQMLVLGAHLYSKKGSRTKPLLLTWLFTYRFVIAPAISISVVYTIGTRWPNFLGNDPMLYFVIAMSNVGPPALTLSAVAVMAQLIEEVEGQVSRVLTVSYAVTPLIAFPVAVSIWMVSSESGVMYPMCKSLNANGLT